jgi:hypothetical protein
MGFLDIISGKAHHWNTVRSEAFQSVCQRLGVLVPNLLGHNAGTIEHLTLVRDELYTFFMVAHQFLGNSPDGAWQQTRQRVRLQSHKDRLMALDSQSYLCLLSVFHAEAVLFIYGPKAEKQGEFQDDSEGYNRHLDLLFQGICHIYSRPKTFAASWQSCEEWLKPDSTKEFAAATSHRALDEIGAILGVDTHPLEAFFLQRIAMEYYGTVTAQLNSSDWRNAIDMELAAYAKNG